MILYLFVYWADTNRGFYLTMMNCNVLIKWNDELKILLQDQWIILSEEDTKLKKQTKTTNSNWCEKLTESKIIINQERIYKYLGVNEDKGMQYYM